MIFAYQDTRHLDYSKYQILNQGVIKMIQNLMQNNRNITYQINISAQDLLKDELWSTSRVAEEFNCTNDHAARLMMQAGRTKIGKTYYTSRLAMNALFLKGCEE